nr:putative capsid protein [Crucivirus sp.]
MPPKYNAVKAFQGVNNQRRLKSAAKAYAGKNAARKRQNTVGAVRRAVNAYGPMISKALSGMGDYAIRDPSSSLGHSYRTGRGIEQGHMGTKHPGAHHGHHPHSSLEKGMMSICHSEYIGDLISSGTTSTTNFVSQSYALNPGNSGTFPWLSSTAINFQHYRFKKLVFEYRPLVSESTASTTATLLSMGSVIMATQYNSVVGPYTTKLGMTESDFAVTTKPSEHSLHAVECDPKFNPLGELFVSAQTSLTVGANSSDIRMQNLGIFEIASSNIPIAGNAAIDLGEIWVHYEVELYKPQINAYLSGLLSSHYYQNTTVGNATASNLFGPNVLSTAQPTAATNNLLGLTFTTNSFSFPLQVTSGSYLCIYKVYASTSQAITIATPTVATNTGTLLTCWSSSAAADINSVANAPETGDSAKNFHLSFIVQVNAPGATLCTVTMGATTPPLVNGGTSFWELFVTPYNSAMLV